MWVHCGLTKCSSLSCIVLEWHCGRLEIFFQEKRSHSIHEKITASANEETKTTETLKYFDLEGTTIIVECKKEKNTAVISSLLI